MTPIDEAALKADPSDSEIMEIAGRWFHTGENQHRADGYYDRSLLCWFSPVQNQHKSDGYYYRSLGTPTNVRGSDLIAFARALLHRSQPVAAEQAEDSAMRKDAMRYRWLRAGNYPISFARSVLNDTPHGIDASIDAEMSGESRK